MKNFEFGDLMLIQIALLSMLKDLDITLETGIAIQETVGKTEQQMKELRKAADDQLPVELTPDSPGKK